MTLMASIWSYEIILPSLIFLLFLFNFFKNNRGPLPWNWPVLGMLPTLLFVEYPKLHDKISDILRRNHGTIVFKGPWFMNSDRVFTCDPANLNHMVSTSFSEYDKDVSIKKIFEILGDQGFFTLNREEWKPLRKTMRRLFGDHQFSMTLRMIVKDNLEKRLLPHLDLASTTHKLVDFQELAHGIMFDTYVELLSGYDSRSLTNSGIPMSQFAHALDDANDIIMSRIIYPKIFWGLMKWMSIGGESKMKAAKKTMDEVAEKLLKKKRQDVVKSEKQGHENQKFDALKFYMLDDVVPRDDIFLKDAFLGLIFAARDTTSVCLTWIFWLLSKNPSVESKIRQELLSCLPSNEAQMYKIFSTEEVKKLPYLHAAFSETLRLYPPGPSTDRVPVRDDTLPSGHHVKKYTPILLSFYAMGRMTSVWGDDCLEFKPERWISEDGHFRLDLSNKFLCAFSGGPRVCPGKDASFMSMKTIAANIIHNYDFRVVDNELPTYRASMFLDMKHGLKVQVIKRWP